MTQQQDLVTLFWAAQSPFVAAIALQQLKTLTKSSDWFNETDTTNWFEIDPQQVEELQNQYKEEINELSTQFLKLQPFTFSDRRFKSENWATPLFGGMASVYLLNSKFFLSLANLVNITDTKAKERFIFLVEQFISASSPSNSFFTNPDALEMTMKTNGASLISGMNYLKQDLLEGKIRHCDVDDFKLGVDLATTAGEVVFQNELFQLIQYAPLTKTQYEIPTLIVPPTINKYYILDLQPNNSFVKHYIEQGHRVFLISWRNPDMSMANTTWENYVQDGVIAAIRVTRAIANMQNINLIGFCIGGTLLSMALSVLIGRGDSQPNTLTLLTCFLDFEDTGPIDVFIDEDWVTHQENTIGGKQGSFGLFKGADMCNVFSLVRPNELWWNYVTSKYLKGDKPKTFDILYWNNDSTNIAGAMYSWYLRNGYLENTIKSGQIKYQDIPIKFDVIKAPTYLYGSEKDHIVPWKSAFASKHLLSGNTRFVLGESGHIAGVINPPADNKRGYWTNDQLIDDPDSWLLSADKHHGSWWIDYFNWINQQSGKKTKATYNPGSPEYPTIEQAPGTYVTK